jgi:agmatinase
MSYPSFLDVGESENPQYLVVPIPYDGTSTYRKGADAGPRALLEASAQVELYDIETDSESYRAGIRLVPRDYDFSTPEAMAASVRDGFRSMFQGDVFPLALGGEHSISAGIIEAAAERHPDLTVVQFDAHADLRDEYEGSRYNHACVMARAQDVARIVQVGIRSMDASEKPRMDRSRVVFAQSIAGGEEWIPRMLSAVTGPVYLTIDLDAFDPSFMGATGTPEPGGLTWYQLLAGVSAIFRNTRVVGADIVELCPNGDHAPEFIAAKLAYKIISYHHVYGGRHG